MTAPLEITLEKDRLYSWCTCGLSEKLPFCDGSHRQHPGQRSLRFQAMDDKPCFLCTCQKTKTPPFCDGSHNDPTSDTSVP